MWRAWGIVLVAFSQDLAAPYLSEDHEFTFRPPEGWSRKAAVSPGVVRFVAPKSNPLCDLQVSHYHISNPKAVAGFVADVKRHVAERFKGAKILEEKAVAIGDLPGHRIVFTHGGTFFLKTLLRRTNLEYYLLDAQMAEADAEKYQPAAEKSIATFGIVRKAPTAEERAALARAREALAGIKVRPELLGEQWHAVYFANRKVGHQRTRLSESDGKYSLEVDVSADYGEGGKDVSVVRGSFSPDGKYQKMDVERTKESKGERWQFRASVVIAEGQAQVQRDLEGHKEERAFPVEEGVVLDDVADLLRRELVARGKGTYLLRTLSPYEDEPDLEMLEVNKPETMELDGKKRDISVVFSNVDRRKSMVYYYGTDLALLRLGGPRDVFSIRAASKDEALKP